MGRGHKDRVSRGQVEGSRFRALALRDLVEVGRWSTPEASCMVSGPTP